MPSSLRRRRHERLRTAHRRNRHPPAILPCHASDAFCRNLPLSSPKAATASRAWPPRMIDRSGPLSGRASCGVPQDSSAVFSSPKGTKKAVSTTLLFRAPARKNGMPHRSGCAPRRPPHHEILPSFPETPQAAAEKFALNAASAYPTALRPHAKATADAFSTHASGNFL